MSASRIYIVLEEKWLNIFQEPIVDRIQRDNAIFSIVSVGSLDIIDPKKDENGRYFCGYNQEEYRGLLNKLKADLLLTMFLRGGAPIVK